MRVLSSTRCGYRAGLARRAARSMRPARSRRILAQGADRVFAQEGFDVPGRSGNVNRSTHAEQAPTRPPRRGTTGPSIPAAAAIRAHRRAVGRGQRSKGHASADRVRCILPLCTATGRVQYGVRSRLPEAVWTSGTMSPIEGRSCIPASAKPHPATAGWGRAPGTRHRAEQLLLHPTGWLSTATTMTVRIGNSHRHYRPGLPSVARRFLSRVLLGSSTASTDWMYSAMYSGGRPCSLPPARTKSLYQL